ncbi:MAG: hypothetical protein KY459_14210 [Acidobacteria bacterium]|nr:hypothetical protein [Acidobacteriota bacterium]
MRRLLQPVVLLILASSCATPDAVDKTELARLVGREGDVRIDAQILGSNLNLGSNIGIVWEVENLRPDPIAIADIVPEASYDPDTGVVSILLGSEVPGNQLLPRLDQILSGETRTFTTSARLGVRPARMGAAGYVRIRLAYLANTEPFAELIALEQKALRNPELAEQFFMPWVESIRFVTTNEVPLQWSRREALRHN